MKSDKRPPTFPSVVFGEDSVDENADSPLSPFDPVIPGRPIGPIGP